jgi:ribosomal-protein-alanine N-acetyltransferase
MAERLRAAEVGDAARLAAIDAETNPSAWSVPALADTLARARGLVAEGADGAPLGFVVYTALAGECEILEIAVTVPARRRGIGRRLLEAALGDAAGAGAARAFLEVRASGAAAIALYRAAGFRIDGRRKSYYRNGEDALLMSLDLHP